MTNRVQLLSKHRNWANIIATISGIISLLIYCIFGFSAALFIGAYGLLTGTGTMMVAFCLTHFTGVMVGTTEGSEEDQLGPIQSARQIFTGRVLESDSDVEVDTGWLIGRLENILVLTLVISGEYTALSIIFAAKSWVRREDTASENTTYYLAGTLVNFTYSIIVGVGTVRILHF